MQVSRPDLVILISSSFLEAKLYLLIIGDQEDIAKAEEENSHRIQDLPTPKHNSF